MRIIKNYAKSYAQENWKLAPLRSAPRCALLLSVVGTPNRGLQEFYSARKIPKCQSSSQKFLSSDFSWVAEKSRRNFWRDCHFCKPYTLCLIARALSPILSLRSRSYIPAHPEHK